MSKTITLLGSTGSIGTQSLDVARMHGYTVFGLAANRSVDRLLAQIAEFRPRYVAVVDPDAYEKLAAALAGVADAPQLLKGAEGLRALAAMEGPEVVLNAVVGIAGLGASLAAIESGHDLALANKESLVTGGHLVTDAVRRHGVHLLPVDSEHSAIFQCLQDQHAAKRLTKILLTIMSSCSSANSSKSRYLFLSFSTFLITMGTPYFFRSRFRAAASSRFTVTNLPR